MADRPPSQPPTTPRWVKIFGIIAALLIVMIVILALAGGNHGPGMHLPGGDDGGHTPPAHDNP